MRTDTWTNIRLKKNWQICLLFPVPKQFLLVFNGKFKCLMQSAFFSQPSTALNYSSEYICQKPNYKLPLLSYSSITIPYYCPISLSGNLVVATSAEKYWEREASGNSNITTKRRIQHRSTKLWDKMTAVCALSS